VNRDWLSLCRASVDDVQRVLAGLPTRAEREPVVGRGLGGDETTAIDKAAEDAIVARFRELDVTIVSEEVGRLGDGPTTVVIDPIDGSLNAKRGIPHHAVSIAVADGATMADVVFAYVYDFGPAEEWRATRGEGAWRNDVPLDREATERRTRDGRLEVLGIEAADPRWVAASIDRLVPAAYRLRALGTIAASLCQVAAARFDAMLTLRDCRGVDAAAGQLIVREGGGCVGFPGLAEPLAAPLDTTARAPLIAARSAHTLSELAVVPT
jgi:myo-inositol-1(or 4)-monophosphatase